MAETMKHLSTAMLEQLALLYLQKQEISSLTPVELLHKYLEVYAMLDETNSKVDRKATTLSGEYGL